MEPIFLFWLVNHCFFVAWQALAKWKGVYFYIIFHLSITWSMTRHVLHKYTYVWSIPRRVLANIGKMSCETELVSVTCLFGRVWMVNEYWLTCLQIVQLRLLGIGLLQRGRRPRQWNDLSHYDGPRFKLVSIIWWRWFMIGTIYHSLIVSCFQPIEWTWSVSRHYYGNDPSFWHTDWLTLGLASLCSYRMHLFQYT